MLLLSTGPAQGDQESRESMDQKKRSISELAISDLAKRLRIRKSEITLASIEPTEWSDTSLGCPKPGLLYAQVITPGFRIELRTGDDQYVYHTDQEHHVILCDEGKPGGGFENF